MATIEELENRIAEFEDIIDRLNDEKTDLQNELADKAGDYDALHDAAENLSTTIDDFLSMETTTLAELRAKWDELLKML